LKVGAVDIGTNSMRLLVVEDGRKLGRWVQVTGLGIGVDSTGRLSDEPMARSIAALRRFGEVMDNHDVVRRAAIATSASRDASNREEFFDLVEEAIGVRPRLISGEEEAALVYRGATHGVQLPEPILAVDIGGGSTELVTPENWASIDIGSVRLTERHLPDRPATPDQLAEARAVVSEMLTAAGVGPAASLIGVSGTWTSLGAIARGLAEYDPDRVHHTRMTIAETTGIVEMLAGKSVEETAAVPSMDPNRAPVILSGAVIAEAALLVSGIDVALISERDSLDAVAEDLLTQA
jgi:exopolyphosphatase/guanosine-5'-triphosphate,3'-diphosphate pyrophosphatase